MDTFREILGRLPSSIGQELEVLPDSVVSQIEEIRLRCGQSVRLQSKNTDRIVSHIVTADDLVKTLNSLIKYSYYAYEEDLAKGFVTIEGGHRVGICGKAVVKNGQTTLIKEISSMNIRFTKEIKGCSDKIARYRRRRKTAKYFNRVAAGLRQNHHAERHLPQSEQPKDKSRCV